jgi:hypothetical protein
MARGLLLKAAALALVVAACAAGTVTGDTDAPSPSTSDAVVSATATTTTAGLSSTTLPTTTTTTTLPATTTSTLAGTEVQIGPANGDVLGVVGVRHDDALNLRSGPGIDARIIDTIAPTLEHLVATGNTRLLPNGSLWINVDHNGTVGWVHLAFVAYPGSTDDATALVVAALGEIPTASSMEELGLVVAGVFASTDPPSRIVMTVIPTPGDFGEVTYDVIGLGDDATLGYRLHVFGQVVDDVLGLHSVERTELCARGVTEDGLCV